MGATGKPGSGRPGPNVEDLQRRKHRIAQAYADDGLSDAEHKDKMTEVDRQLRQALCAELPDLTEVGELLEHLGQLWQEATPEERRTLLHALIERVYLDLEDGLVGVIGPVPAFRRLLEGAIERADDAAVLLVSPEELEEGEVWRWWRRGELNSPYPYCSAFVKR